MTEDEEERVLSVGGVLGAPDAENRAWQMAINDLIKKVRVAGRGVASPLSVTIAFHIDGPDLTHGYEAIGEAERYAQQRKLSEDLSNTKKVARVLGWTGPAGDGCVPGRGRNLP